MLNEEMIAEVAKAFGVIRGNYTASDDSAAMLTVAYFIKRYLSDKPSALAEEPSAPVKRGPGRPPKNVD